MSPRSIAETDSSGTLNAAAGVDPPVERDEPELALGAAAEARCPPNQCLIPEAYAYPSSPGPGQWPVGMVSGRGFDY